MAFWSALFSTKKGAPVVRERLCTQLYRADGIAMRVAKPSGIARRLLAPGLFEVIVEDQGDRERVVSWDDLGGADDALFAIARSRAAASETKVASQVLETVQVMISNSFYLSAFVLETLETKRYKYGALFVPLSWHHWCVHVIQPGTVPPTVLMVEAVAREVATMMNVRDHERLRDDVYWYKPDGVIEQLELVGADADRHATSTELAGAIDRAWRDAVTTASP
jgi:hypothetical protein